ncbi:MULTISPECIES: triacylglycerol lipase [unclassified Ruegeria]|uniref:esterase/lipase family protein n=1 Tax=unclassified Ruegeria TaxID=2625375 RepID=UPI0014918AC2|nr:MULTISPECIES: alpha/beta hydrolase [unclassified Ruegeria]NOD35610.1 alpha/beta fold hydrolase [Ruegeria sp. HKCCD7296]NOE42976.1 alpha/beta fold hydrolase [Ruegeria sp. HKCCD7319]
MNEPDRIQLTCEAAQIRVLAYEPGKVLKVRCEMHWAGKAILSMFSLVFFVIGASFATSILEGLGNWIQPVCGLSALALWLRYSLRGAWVSFNLQSRGYTFRTVVESGTVCSWPEFEIKSQRTGDLWEAVLFCDGQPLGRPRKDRDRRVAEAIFVEFTSLFTSPDHALEQMRKVACRQREKLQESTVDRDDCECPCDPTDVPLIYLIHGTRAPNAPWTYEESSDLVAGIREADVNAEFKRFQWTGRNSSKDRQEAAKELAEAIAPVLDTGAQEVVLIGHSHGGNVALQAATHLNQKQRKCLRFCCLATPFLGSSRRFDAWDYFERLPEIIRDNIHLAIVASVMAISCLLYLALQDPLLPESFHVAIGAERSGNNSFIPAIAWILLVPWLTIKLIERIATSVLNNGANQEPEISTSNNTLVCAYSHDEAYMALSVISNLMALVQFGVFKMIDGVVFFFRKTRVFDVFFGWSWLLIWFVVVLSFFLFSIVTLARMIFPADFFKAWSIQLSSIGFDPNVLPINWLIYLMLAALLLVGLSIITCFCVVLFFGFMRFVVFWIVGVSDQISTERGLIEAFMGSYVVSSVPFGDTQVRFIPGRFKFNHSEIYRDPDCISQVVVFLRGQKISPD